MADVRVQYANKTQHRHEHITHLGGATWTWPVRKVIESLENGSNTFFTMEAGTRAEIRVRQGVHGPYVQTVADNAWANNLLSLPACVVASAA